MDDSSIITPRLGLDGAFIQFDNRNAINPVERLDKEEWEDVLDAMQQAGIRIVILQRLQHDEETYMTTDAHDPTDPTTVILQYADTHNMQVFIGLRSRSSQWDQNVFQNEPIIVEERQKSLTLIDEIVERYGRYSAFTGWYLPHEISNELGWYSNPDLLHDFFGSLQKACVQALNKPVAHSPYFTGTLTDEFADVYGTFLDKTHINLVMLQDGIGRQSPHIYFLGDIIPATMDFFAKFSMLCKDRNVEIWINVESFNLEDNNYTPTEINRLSLQIGIAAPFVNRLVTFDFFHYMNPFGHIYDGDFRTAQKKLYDDYKRVYVDRS